jgi:cell division protein FtsN
LALFLVGLYAGRSQGVNYALKNYGQEAVRLPTPRAVRPENVDISTAQIASELSDELALSKKPLNDPNAVSLSSDVSRQKHYDFSGSLVEQKGPQRKLTNTPSDSVAGFAAKPAGAKSLEASARARLKSDTLKLASNAKQEVKKQHLETIKTDQITATIKPQGKGVSTVKKDDSNTVISAKKTSTKRSKTVINSGEENGFITRGWYVQVGAYRKKAEAGRITVRLDSHRVKSQVQEAVVRGKRFYRVLLGPYASKPDAANVVTKLKSLKVSSGEPFIRQIK